MLKALLKKQLRESLSFLVRGRKQGKRPSKALLIAYGVLFAYVIGVFGFLFYMMGDALCPALCFLGLDWLYFAIMGTLAVLLGVAGSVFFTYAQLYQAGDNELLLAMPIRPAKILFARMLALYIQVFGFEALVLLPAQAVYMQNGAGAAAVAMFVPVMLLLPLFTLAISCALGYLVALLCSRIHNKTLLAVLGMALFMGGYFYIVVRAEQLFKMLLQNSAAVAKVVKTVMYPVYQASRAMTGNIAGLMVFALISVGVFAAVYGILAKSFWRIVATRRGGAQKKYREKTLRSGSVHAALLKKELRRFTTCTVYLLNCGLGSLFMIAGGIFVLIKGASVLPMLKLIPGVGNMLLPASCAIVAMLAGMNMVSAPSVSLEGKNIWILQSMPVNAWYALRAKIELHMIVSLAPALFCAAAVCAVLKASAAQTIAVLIFETLYVCFVAVFGLAVNLKLPNLHWSSETVPVKQGMSIAVSMLGGIGTVFALAGLWYAVRNLLDVTAFLLLAGFVLGIACAALLAWIRRRGAKIFANLA